MTTALELVTDAAVEIGVVATGQTLSAGDSALMLRKLNQRLGTWSNARLMTPTLAEVSVTLNGAQSYTIGPSGADVTATRPLKVERASATDAGGIEYPVRVLTREEWDAIAFKNVSGGPPDCVWYDAQNTTGRVYVYPKSTGYTLKLDCLSRLATFATLATTCALPDGYENAIVLTLAEDCAGSFSRPITPDLARRARGARAAIKRTNTETLLLEIDPAAEPYQIERGF
jgi:hypothetical protein